MLRKYEYIIILQGTIKKAGGKLGEMEAELNRMNPVARDEAKLNMQGRQIEVSLNKHMSVKVSKYLV